MSAFGGVIALNRPVDEALAERLHEQFVEVLIAPGYEDGALEVLQQKEAIRILRGHRAPRRTRSSRTSSGCAAGSWSRTRDGTPEPRELMEVVTKTQPTEEQWADLLFAWTRRAATCARTRSCWPRPARRSGSAPAR